MADAPYSARPVVLGIGEYFAWHAANPGCWCCTWTLSGRPRRFTLNVIHGLCPVHSLIRRSTQHPQATERMRFLASVPE